MFRVVFFDKMRETYHAVGGVIQMDKAPGSYWRLVLKDGSMQTLPQKWFTIHRVEI